MEKLTRLMAMLLLGAGVISLASCLKDDDDDDSRMTAQEYASYMDLMEGRNYSGYVYFGKKTENGDYTSSPDSLLVQATVVGRGDSLITVEGIPSSLLARDVKSEPLREALSAQPSQLLKAKFYINQYSNGIVYFGVYPYSLNYKLTYDNDEHDVTLHFMNYINYNGAYQDRLLVANVYVHSIVVDGETQQTFYRQSSLANANLNCFLQFELEKQNGGDALSSQGN